VRALWQVLAAAILTTPAPTFAAEAVTLDLTIKDHRFEPTELKVPAGTPFVIRITNMDPTAEEFDSSALKVEKVIAGNGEGLVRKNHGLGAGRYEFIGEYHPDTAKGVLVAE
jgi:plastocyanin